MESLKGDSIDEATTRQARRSGVQGVFILIAKKESKLEVLSSHRFSAAIPRSVCHKVREAFVENFRRANFDEGLRKGIATLDSELERAKAQGTLPQAEKPPSPGEITQRSFFPGSLRESSKPFAKTDDQGAATFGLPRQERHLVIRNQVRLSLEGARIIIAAAEGKAASMNLKVNIAVVDDGGHLLSFERMDGARPASAYTAITKATTAATFRQPTGPIPRGTANPDPLLNISLQNAALASGGKITTLYGGLPVEVDGQVIGGVGVGGGSGEQDAQIAGAGIEQLLHRLKSQESWLPESHADPAKPEGGRKIEPKSDGVEKKPGSSQE
jgi:glc operon protein GlcG